MHQIIRLQQLQMVTRLLPLLIIPILLLIVFTPHFEVTLAQAVLLAQVIQMVGILVAMAAALDLVLVYKLAIK